MSVRVADNVIHLEGRCMVEDAETLLLAMQQHAGAVIDVSGVQRLHMAVAQVLMALKPQIRGSPSDPFVLRHVLPSLHLG